MMWLPVPLALMTATVGRFTVFAAPLSAEVETGQSSRITLGHSSATNVQHSTSNLHIRFRRIGLALGSDGNEHTASSIGYPHIKMRRQGRKIVGVVVHVAAAAALGRPALAGPVVGDDATHPPGNTQRLSPEGGPCQPMAFAATAKVPLLR
jgi:hypothetical protein